LIYANINISITNIYISILYIITKIKKFIKKGKKMANIKWIKIVTDIFDDEKMLLIETLPEADSIIVIWFKLLCLAGKQNNSGVFTLNGKIPYTDKMLATIFRRKETTVNLALKTFEEFGMIEIINNTITIPNWSKHQNFDKIEAKNEYMKEYMKQYREKQKLLTEGQQECKVNSKVNSKVNVSLLEKKREDKKREEKKRIEYNKNIKEDNRNKVVEIYNAYCTNLPQVQKLTDKRKSAIDKFIKEFTEEQFEQVCKIANSSDFLIGNNDRKWKADFDFLMRTDKATNILENKYSNSKSGMNDFKELMKEAQNEQDGNNTSNNTTSW
jgi:predicted phage replisome organizer